MIKVLTALGTLLKWVKDVVYFFHVRKSFNLSHETSHATSLGTSVVSFVTPDAVRACFSSSLDLTGFSMCLRALLSLGWGILFM